MHPPFTGGCGQSPGPYSAEKVEVSKVQLLVSEHMFGQVVMRVYMGTWVIPEEFPRLGSGVWFAAQFVCVNVLGDN